MKPKTVILCFFLSIMLALASTSVLATTDGGVTPIAYIDCNETTSVTVHIGESITISSDISKLADVYGPFPDDLSLDYHWYLASSSNIDEIEGTPIDNATGTTFSPSTAVAGTFYYYYSCMGGDFSSNVVTINVLDTLNPELESYSETFDKYFPSDISVLKSDGDYKLCCVKAASTELKKDIDYTITDDFFTLKQSYLSTLATGTMTITLDYGAPTNPTLLVTIVNSAPMRSIQSAPATNGCLSVSHNQANIGTVITINATPDEGYMLESLSMNGTSITGNSFVMPDCDVILTATFKKGYSINITTDLECLKNELSNYINSPKANQAFSLGDTVKIGFKKGLINYLNYDPACIYALVSINVNGSNIPLKYNDDTSEYVAEFVLTANLLGENTNITVVLTPQRMYTVTGIGKPITALKGTTISFQPPVVDKSLRLTKVTCLREGSTTGAIILTPNNDNDYSFTMPNYNVEVCFEYIEVVLVRITPMNNASIILGSIMLDNNNPTIAVTKGSTPKLVIKPNDGFQFTSSAKSKKAPILYFNDDNGTNGCTFNDSLRTLTYMVPSTEHNVTLSIIADNLIEPISSAAVAAMDFTYSEDEYGNVSVAIPSSISVDVSEDQSEILLNFSVDENVQAELYQPIGQDDLISRVATCYTFSYDGETSGSNTTSEKNKKLLAASAPASTLKSQWMIFEYPTDGTLILPLPESTVNCTIEKAYITVAKKSNINSNTIANLSNANMTALAYISIENDLCALDENTPLIVGDTLRLVLSPLNGYTPTQKDYITFGGVQYALTFAKDGTIYADIPITEANYFLGNNDFTYVNTETPAPISPEIPVEPSSEKEDTEKSSLLLIVLPVGIAVLLLIVLILIRKRSKKTN